MIRDNLAQIEKRIQRACERAGRARDEVTLVAVTKTVDIPIVEEAIDAGINDAGENIVQELERKFEAIGDRVRWHLIGHLQRNKVKSIIDRVDLIHSVDSVRLAKEIDKRAAKADRKVGVLLQVNVAEEAQKYGIYLPELFGIIEEIMTYEHIEIQGLMNIAPYVDDPEEVRGDFTRMRTLFEELKGKYPDLPLRHLSMGMTGDFEVAIEEGATLVRVGSGIFGDRVY